MSKRYSSYSFHPMSAKFYENIGWYGGREAITFLAIGQVLTLLWHFEILTWESMGKPETWSISKTVDRRAKWTNIWDSGSYSTYM